MRSPPLLAALALLYLTAGLPSFATARSDALVLYGPEGPDDALEARALATYNLQSDQRRAVPRIQHVGVVVEGLAEVDLLGSDDVMACPGTTLDVESFRRDLDRALQYILYVEVEEAALVLDRLDALLPCITEVLPREDLARISYLHGVGLAYTGALDEARERYRRALIVYPNLTWDSRFPPALEEVFTEAVHDALRSASVPLQVEARVGEVATLWIDGLQVPAGGGPQTLATGLHMLQWQLTSGEFVTRAVVIDPADQLALVAREDIARAALTGQGSDLVLEMAAEALRGTTAGEAGSAVFLADLQSIDLLHRFDTAHGTWTLTDPGAVELRLRQHRMTTAGGVILVAGGITLAVGAVMGIAGYSEANGLLDDVSEVETTDEAENKAAQYRANRNAAYVGYALTGVGGAAVAAGIPLTIAGTRGGKRRIPRDLQARLVVTPASIALSGSF